MLRLNRCPGVLCLLMLFVSSEMNAAATILPATTLQKMLIDVETMQASFTQVTNDSNHNSVQSSAGDLWLGAVARFRIETTSPFRQTLVSDGVDFWSYEEDLEQVVVQTLETDVKKVPILLFGSKDKNLLENYQVSIYEDDRSKVQSFILEPLSTESVFEVITLSFVDSNPIEISIRDSLGQNTKIEFRETRLNTVILDKVFQFKVPDGTDVIDDR